MGRQRLTRARVDPVPCAADPGAGGWRHVHPEGRCTCFTGGPAPVRLPTPEIAVLADRPGVFDTSWIGQGTRRRTRPVRGRVSGWLRGLVRR
ncbi:hypothetical protein [Planosporangium mesophilum]|nr:hypothetical protein [Planosporangium mesophilum]NJC82905.1 hypothetical protein [Planosporangium mesophilum]